LWFSFLGSWLLLGSCSSFCSWSLLPPPSFLSLFLSQQPLLSCLPLHHHSHHHLFLLQLLLLHHLSVINRLSDIRSAFSVTWCPLNYVGFLQLLSLLLFYYHHNYHSFLLLLLFQNLLHLMGGLFLTCQLILSLTCQTFHPFQPLLEGGKLLLLPL
jgi:hypothetical protein